MCDAEKNTKLLGLLGLCMRARGLVCGTQMICDTLKESKPVFMVLMAKDVSENTGKRICDRCRYYGVRLENTDVTVNELAHALGKSGELAAVAVTDKNFASGLEKLLT